MAKRAANFAKLGEFSGFSPEQCVSVTAPKIRKTGPHQKMQLSWPPRPPRPLHPRPIVRSASVHRSDAIKEKIDEWNAKNIEIFWLPPYSPQLNLIEILWRFMKYEWIEFEAYESWEALVRYVEKVLKGFGEDYVINFG